MEWRARLEMDFATKLSKHAEKYRTILSADPYLPLQSVFITSLERTQEYADQLIKSQVKNVEDLTNLYWPIFSDLSIRNV